MKILGIIIFVFLIVAGYLVYVVLHGWSLVRSAPREDMFICPSGHGPLRKDVLINFMGMDYCPICFHNKLKQAERGELK